NIKNSSSMISQGALRLKLGEWIHFINARYPTWILVKIERLVLDENEVAGIRIYAWAKLFKSWASLRWSDIQAIKPIELRLEEGRLFTILRRTKTSGPNRRIKELPVCVSEVAFYEDARWISVGFNLLKENASYKRDYLLPRLRSDMTSMDRKMASYADAVVATAAVLARIGIPTAVQGYWTEHSERSILPTALAILGVTDSEKDILRRWKPKGSDTYVRSYGGRVARLQSRYAAAAREDSHYSMLDEREIAANLLDWLQEARMDPPPISEAEASKIPSRSNTVEPCVELSDTEDAGQARSKSFERSKTARGTAWESAVDPSNTDTCPYDADALFGSIASKLEALKMLWRIIGQSKPKLGEEASKAIVDPLVHMWKTGRIFADLVPMILEVEDNPPEERGEDSEDSQGPEPASSSKVAKIGPIG
ncbi:unnamed protein product, partial [Symbiodinium pilosum]